jgi:glycosyltransferase involved in cell wall biosynthesis
LTIKTDQRVALSPPDTGADDKVTVESISPSRRATASPSVLHRHRVLMLAPTSFFGDYGCHVRILEEARALQALGHCITIVTYALGRNLPDVAIERTRPVPWHASYEVGSSRHKLAFDVLLSAKALDVARRIRPDIIHGHLHEGAFIGYPISRIWRAPLVFDFQGSMTGEMIDHRFLNPEGPWYQPTRRLEDVINRLPAAIITSTYHSADLCAREFGVDAGRLHTVPDCVNPDAFRPDVLDAVGKQALKARLDIPPGRSVIVYLGLLADYQGTDHLLAAAALMLQRQSDLHFLIMGYPNVPRYQARARGLGIADHVTFTGRVLYEDAPAYLSLGDIAAAPKLSTTEGSGKVLNYMAMALPTVAFATPVSREYLRDDGVYASPGDAAGLAEAMLALLANPDQASWRAQALRRRAVEEYSWADAARRIVEIYDSVKHET